ncbi:hypothetical protein PRIP_07953 [Listeria riparia FSL S10-1204]|uniref:Uncharacterized protein n=1 Tax=Listeria riparia FSL S10-1204 TaxID=1265816 RepID=W7DE10_9LIST|nr:hypothetical protein PRIP_07953 [Listeria riparia FSL S10-1204]
MYLQSVASHLEPQYAYERSECVIQFGVWRWETMFVFAELGVVLGASGSSFTRQPFGNFTPSEKVKRGLFLRPLQFLSGLTGVFSFSFSNQILTKNSVESCFGGLLYKHKLTTSKTKFHFFPF